MACSSSRAAAGPFPSDSPFSPLRSYPSSFASGPARRCSFYSRPFLNLRVCKYVCVSCMRWQTILRAAQYTPRVNAVGASSALHHAPSLLLRFFFFVLLLLLLCTATINTLLGKDEYLFWPPGLCRKVLHGVLWDHQPSCAPQAGMPNPTGLFKVFIFE